MRRWLGVVILLVLAAGSATAQCCGDCDGVSGVTIDELVGAVNNALAACGAATATSSPTASHTPTPENTPTPTRVPTRTPTSPPRCRSSFTSSGTNLCTFRGRFNLGCGNSLFGAFSSDGRTLIVQIDTMLASPPRVHFSARVDSATSATLTAWSSDDFQTMRPTAGSIQLANNGQQLILFPNNPPFMIQSCNFVQYNGAFVSGAASSARGVLQSERENTARFQRLLTWQSLPPPELAD